MRGLEGAAGRVGATGPRGAPGPVSEYPVTQGPDQVRRLRSRVNEQQFVSRTRTNITNESCVTNTPTLKKASTTAM